MRAIAFTTICLSSVSRGEAAFCVGEESFIIRRGDLLLIPAGMYYSASTKMKFHYYSHLNADALENAAMPTQQMGEGADAFDFYLPETRYDCCFLERFVSLGEHFERVLYMLSRCREYALARTSAVKLLLDLRVIEPLVEISELCAKRDMKQNAYSDLLLRMLVWLQSSYAEPMTLADLAERFGLSKTYIARLFCRYLNTTATNYVHHLRLRHAAELLRLSQMNVSQIAAGVDFATCIIFRACSVVHMASARRSIAVSTACSGRTAVFPFRLFRRAVLCGK